MNCPLKVGGPGWYSAFPEAFVTFVLFKHESFIYSSDVQRHLTCWEPPLRVIEPNPPEWSEMFQKAKQTQISDAWIRYQISFDTSRKAWSFQPRLTCSCPRTEASDCRAATFVCWWCPKTLWAEDENIWSLIINYNQLLHWSIFKKAY